jgi:hypothetical protein
MKKMDNCLNIILINLLRYSFILKLKKKKKLSVIFKQVICVYVCKDKLKYQIFKHN